MHKIYLSKFILLLLPFFCTSIAAQDINDVGAYKVTKLKEQGLLKGTEHYTNRFATPLKYPDFTHVNANKTGSPALTTNTASTSCNCWIDRDATWQVAQFDGSGVSGGPGVAPDYRNDDWSTLPITLPFNLCFYGQNINQVYINNNGNVSIGAAYSTFTANSFPDPTYTMIAPFWADVDTRGPLSGIVHYKIAPKYLIVQWEDVGYFNMMDDKLNTFQLIITDGTDPIINLGQNVAFCYKDMQWTTGGASGGVNGFGGTPATVGVNQGNGVDYIQFGLYDAPGVTYDGPYGNNDGVDWLDNQSFTMNACISSSNIPPVLNSLNVCDTIHLCENTTNFLTANYLSPEQSQTTHINFFAFGMQGVTVVSNDTGNTATLVLQIVGSASNLGFHTISITAIDNGSPAAATTNNFVIEIMPAPLPSFTFSPASPMPTNTSVTFTNTSPVVAGATYSWDFGDGSPPSSATTPTHIYGTDGTFPVILTATYPNGCTTTSTDTIIVTSCTPATFTVLNVCTGAPSTITFTSTATAAAVFTWDFNGGTVLSGTGQGPYTVSWPTAGNYTVSLDVTEPLCSSSVSMPVIVNPVPVASITPVSQLCEGDSPNISFNGSSTATANYNWNFGGGTVLSGTGAGPYSVQYTTVGNATVSVVVDDNGCLDSTTINVVTNPIPNSPFTIPPSACAYELITINYTGTATAGANYVWDFNGGNATGSGQGPFDVSWTTGGNYNVTLTVTENGCTSTVSSMPVAITDVPVVSISSVAPLCEGATTNVDFTGVAGAGANYQWSFINATVVSGTGSGPYTLQYAAAGQDQIILSVTENNCTSSDTIDVTVNPIPTSVFTVGNAACVNQPISITYTGSANAAATYNWLFGSATVLSGNGQGPYSLTWNSQGAYQVSLTVTENGCVSPQTDINATVNPLPIVYAGSDQTACSGVNVPLGDVSVPGFVYQWSPAANLSDPTISNPSAAIQNMTNADARHDYYLSVTDANGCINTDTVSVFTHPVPVIGFPKLPGQCLDNNQFNFSAFANITNGVNYNWQFGGPANVASSSVQNVSVEYSSVGTFPVQLTGDFSGCPAQPYSDTVTVYAMPAPRFQPLVTEGCRPLLVPFSNLTPGNGNSYNWNFGDGGTDISFDPNHTFNTAGTYSIELNARSINGCSVDTIYKDIIRVFADANAVFIPNPQIANVLAPTVQFQDYSTNALTYVWDFGDSSSISNDPSPNHTYAGVGTYDVTLMVISPNGCIDTVHGTVIVEENFSFYIPDAFTPNGDGVNDYFRGYGIAINSYEMHIYNRWGELIYNTNNYDQPWDGKVSDNVQNDVFVYRIELTDLHGLKHTFVGDVTVVY